MRIVFLVRALFQENLMPKYERAEVSMPAMVDIFDKFSAISACEFRTTLHAIQLENLRSISKLVITNKAEAHDNTNRTYACATIQPTTLELLMELNDDDVIIPIDDDDWVNPAIGKLDFAQNKMNIWNAVGYGHDGILWKAPKNKELTEETLILAKQTLSNCYSLPARFVKFLIATKDNNNITHILLRHSLARETARALHLEETIHEPILSVYVKHPCNGTVLIKFNGLEVMQEVFDDITGMKRRKEPTIPKELEWATSYIQKLRIAVQAISR